jgi:H/ACA ribonucleoprotein complex subunit 3
MILKVCKKCGKYSLEEECCGAKTRNPHPPRFSVDDKFGKYRRMAKNNK